MRTFALGAALIGAWLVAESHQPARSPVPVSHVAISAATPIPKHDAAPASHPAEAIPVATLTQVVQQYCVVCHNDQLLTGNVSMVGFDVDKAADKAETAERMIRKLRAGMMPPPGIPRPGGDTLQALVETL